MSQKGLQKGTVLPYMDTKPTIDETAFVAQGVRVIGDVTIKEGANIWYNTVLRGDEHPIVIGKYTNIQDNSTLHIMHDWPCIVGDYVTVGHGAIVHGCTIGDNCLIGMGAIVLSYAEIGENSIIAAGSVVTERAKIPPRSMVMGIPGKVVRQITDEEVAMLRKSALDYHALAQRYKEWEELPMGVSTKTGDKGKTSLFTGERVDKDSLRVEAYGIVDEINSALGLARANCKNQEVKDTIFALQKMNMSMMAELASTGDAAYITDEAHIAVLDNTIDTIEAALPPLTAFLIAGDTVGGAALDLARTTIRRAERAVWRLSKTESVRPQVLIALNRQSDLCFLLMRKEEL